jgi:hypothetical protein
MAGISDKALKSNYAEINIGLIRELSFRIKSLVMGVG